MTWHDSGAIRGPARPFQITVDGPAGAGKSTIGRGLAEALGCSQLDTGLMYRAVTCQALERGIPLSDADALTVLARSIPFALDSEGRGLLIGGVAPGPEVRTPAVEGGVSEVSAHPSVREVLVQRQRDLATDGCVVVIGRDIGTVVLPQAPIKFWITASAEERARRRSLDRSGGETGSDTLEAIRTRDRKDSGRVVSPLLQAPDAIVIATDDLTPGEALQCAMDAIDRRRMREEMAR